MQWACSCWNEDRFLYNLIRNEVYCQRCKKGYQKHLLTVKSLKKLGASQILFNTKKVCRKTMKTREKNGFHMKVRSVGDVETTDISQVFHCDKK